MAHPECKYCDGGFHPIKVGDDLVCSNCQAAWEPILVEDDEEEDVVLLSDDSVDDDEDLCVAGDCDPEDDEDTTLSSDIDDSFDDESDIPEDVEFDPLADECEVPERLGHTDDGLSVESEIPIRFGHDDEEHLPDHEEHPSVPEVHIPDEE